VARGTKAWVVSLLSVVTIASACGSSHTAAGSGASQAYTLGVLTDLTGVASSAESTTPLGVKAGVGLANSEGYHIKYEVVDAESSPTGALTAARKMVEQDHVFAVIAVSGLTFAAAGYLTSHGVPVIGANTDGVEWIASRNMFSVFGTSDYTRVASTTGQFFKMEGATNIATLGYSIVPSAAESAKGDAVSAEAAGLKAGYVNANFPFGGTNVEPVALAMKQDGVDGYTGAVEENTSFALIEALRQLGIPLKVALISVGYGADLVQGGPGAEQAAQGVYFTVSFEPVEMHTAATERLQSALQKYAGVPGDPSLNEYIGYASVDAFVTGLKAAGAHPTQASLINALLGIRHYDAAGLYGSHSIGFAMDQRGLAQGADNCIWVTRYEGTSFHLIPGAEPLCGTILPGKRVSAS
jgi:branched-chain amino acid transport system substrate-binding protein